GVLAGYLKNDRYPSIPIGTHCVAPRCRHIEGPVLHSAARSQGKHSPPAPHCNVTVHEPKVDLLSQIVFDTTLPIDLGKDVNRCRRTCLVRVPWIGRWRIILVGGRIRDDLVRGVLFRSERGARNSNRVFALVDRLGHDTKTHIGLHGGRLACHFECGESPVRYGLADELPHLERQFLRLIDDVTSHTPVRGYRDRTPHQHARLHPLAYCVRTGRQRRARHQQAEQTQQPAFHVCPSTIERHVERIAWPTRESRRLSRRRTSTGSATAAE